jgi:hypothetical protein
VRFWGKRGENPVPMPLRGPYFADSGHNHNRLSGEYGLHGNCNPAIREIRPFDQVNLSNLSKLLKIDKSQRFTQMEGRELQRAPSFPLLLGQ